MSASGRGKLMSEMLGQLNCHPAWRHCFAGLADEIEVGAVPIDKPDHIASTDHEPVGVVGCLTAWNSPPLFVAWKCAAAIAAVVKPSEFASASPLEFAKLTREAGFPDGVFNVVTGLSTECVAHEKLAESREKSVSAFGALERVDHAGLSLASPTIRWMRGQSP